MSTMDNLANYIQPEIQENINMKMGINKADQIPKSKISLTFLSINLQWDMYRIPYGALLEACHNAA